MDVLPTVVRLAGAQPPTDRPMDGIDISKLLFEKEGKVERPPFFYYRGERLFAVRMGEWKAHYFTQSGYGGDKPEEHPTPLLFHLGEDPGERWDRSAKHAEVLARIKDAVARHTQGVVAAPSQLIETE